MLLLLVSLLLSALPHTAYAANEVSGTLCTIVEYIKGDIGKSMATIAIMVVGIGSLMNKISWPFALSVTVGIALTFGAVNMVSALGGAGTCTATPAPHFQCNGATPAGNLFTYEKVTPDKSGGVGAITTDPSQSGGACDQIDGIFARLLCFFKTTIGSILSGMFCKFQAAMQGPLKVAITLVVAVFGVMILTGMSEAKPKEIIGTLLKIALVWGFATNADLAIGIGYRLFIGIADTGSAIALNAFSPRDANGVIISQLQGQNMLTQPDLLFKTFFHYSSGGATDPAYELHLPPACKTALWLMAILFIFALPMIVMMLVMMLVQYIGLYARAMLGYLTALVLISFLFVLSPLFISFALFNTTRPLFEQWTKYLLTYSLQMVIVFCFFAMLGFIPIGDFFFSLGNILREYDVTWGTWLLFHPQHFCGICSDYRTVIGANGMEILACGTDPSTPVLAFWQLYTRTDLLVFVVGHILALWLVGMVMEDFLKRSHELAKTLGGVPMAAALGGAGAEMGRGAGIQFVGAESVRAAYINMKNKMRETEAQGFFGRLTYVPRALLRGAKGAGAGLLMGAEDKDSEAYKSNLIAINRAEERVKEYNDRFKKAESLTLQWGGKVEAERKLLAKAHRSGQNLGVRRAALADAESKLRTAMKNQDNRQQLLHEALAAKDELERTGGPFTAGLMGNRKRRSEGSIAAGLRGFSDKDELGQKLAEKKQERYEQETYGKVLKKGGLMGEDYYYLMKMPEGGAKEDAQTLSYLRDNAKAKLTRLESQLADHQAAMPPDKLAKYQRLVAQAGSAIQNSSNAGDIEKLIRQLSDAGDDVP